MIGEEKMAYRVLIDDNFHYMDESARTTLGEFATLEAAVAAARRVVDEFLEGALEPGMTADKLYQVYTGFGDDPFIVGPGVTTVVFSAWDYARERCAVLCPPSAPGQAAGDAKSV